MHDKEIFEKANELLKKGEVFSIVTIIEAEGSAPGKPGFKMLVTRDGESIGTVGGGSLEHILIKKAVKAIESQKRILYKTQLKDIGMSCGGNVVAFVDVIGIMDRVIIFGGGHVGLAIYKVLSLLPFNLIVVEDREEFATKERFPKAEVIKEDPIHFASSFEIKGRDFVILVTRTHEMDYKILREILKRDKIPYFIGMIASKAKTEKIKGWLRKDGISEERINAIHAPLGVPIKARTPEEIAISVVAEIIKEKER